MADMRASIQAAVLRQPAGSLRADEDALRVLLVEDSRDFGSVVCSTLTGCRNGHFDVEQAPGLEQAIERLTSECYDALLLDLGLPNGRHEETIEAASTIARQLPVILLTGTRSERLLDEACFADVCRHHLQRAALADTILRAVKQYRRFGLPQPVFCRITN